MIDANSYKISILEDDNSRISSFKSGMPLRHVSLEETLKSRLFRKFVIFILYYVIFIAVFNSLEGWDILDSVYFLTATVVTVGYGDFVPTSETSRLCVVIAILIGVPIVLNICLEIAESQLVGCQEFIIETFTKKFYPNSRLSPLQMAHYRVYLSVIVVLILLLCGALFFSGNEGWTFITGIYFSTITIAGVGYGEVTVKKRSSIVFDIFFLLGGACLFTTAASNIFNAYYKRVDANISDHVKHGSPVKPLTMDWVDSIIPSDSGPGTTVPPDRLVIKILLFQEVALYKEDIEPIAQIFDELRQNATSLNRDDVVNFMHKYNEDYCGVVSSPLHT